MGRSLTSWSWALSASTVSSLLSAGEEFPSPPGQRQSSQRQMGSCSGHRAGSTQGKYNVNQPHRAFLFLLGLRQLEPSRNLTWL